MDAGKQTEGQAGGTGLAAFASHPRNWRSNRYVYPVCSRRSGGISIGVNLNPDKACNFDCVYCQVDRTVPSPIRRVELGLLGAELGQMLEAAAGGRLLDEPEFRDLPEPLRRINDIAFSGDGEPTACPQFAEAVGIADELAVRAGQAGLPDGSPKLVLITNATLFERAAVRAGLERLHARRGEIWGKLEAGSEEYYRRVERTTIPLARVIGNLAWAAARWPIVIQSCFMRLDGQGPGDGEIAAYCDRLDEVRAAGPISLVQVYTVARPPAESFVTPLTGDEVDRIVSQVRARLPGLAVRPFYGPQ